MRSIAITSVISMPGLWWITNTPDDYNVPHLASPRLPVDQDGRDPCKTTDQDQEVARILSQDTYSFLVLNVAGAVRYDGTQWASNSPCEDRFLHGKFPSPWNGDANGNDNGS